MLWLVLELVRFSLFDDVTADGSSRMTTEVYRDIFFVQTRPSTSKLIWKALHLAAGQWPQTYCQSKEGVFQDRKAECCWH
uniref:Secreted protein n=1 Tax=Anguilla anguilla TaxID=7936 RepID=A0A0E9SCW7_ANGAN